MKLLVDSSAWIEVLSLGPKAKKIETEIKKSKLVIVPTLVLFEVYRKIAKSVSEDRALQAVAFISQHQVEDLTREVSLTGADLSIQHNLAMADALIAAHAFHAKATVITLDNDFRVLTFAKVI